MRRSALHFNSKVLEAWRSHVEESIYSVVTDSEWYVILGAE